MLRLDVPERPDAPDRIVADAKRDLAKPRGVPLLIVLAVIIIVPWTVVSLVAVVGSWLAKLVFLPG